MLILNEVDIGGRDTCRGQLKNRVYKLFENKYYHGIISAVITAIMFLMFIISNRIVPFGDKFWMTYDMKRQYLDFYSYYRTVFEGKNNLFYSSSISFGSSAMGFFTYYLSSPWLLLTLFFKRAKLPVAVTLMIGIKIVLASFFCDLFLSHYMETSDNEDESCGKRLIFSTGYAFCTYMISNSINPMWLDVFYLMPLVIFMLDRLMFKNRKMGYILSLALLILNNYYIAYMVCIFIVFWTFYRIFFAPCSCGIQKKGKIRCVLEVVESSVRAVLLDAAFLIPTAMELNNSPKDIFELGLETNKGNLGLGTIASKFFFLSYDSNQTINGTPLLYAGTVIIVLTILYYLNKRIPFKEKIGMAVFMMLFVLSFMIDGVNIIWHAGMEPSGYPYREAFMFVFLCMVCSCRCMCNIRTGLSSLRILFAAAVTFAMWGLIVIAGKNLYYMNPRMIVMNLLLILSAVLVVLIIKNTEYKEWAAVTATVMVCMLQFSELSVNGVYVFREQNLVGESNVNYYEKKISDVESNINHIKSSDDSWYRMENMSPREQNDPMMYDYNGITHYSSAGSLYSRNMLKRMGYNDDGLYADFGRDNTSAADALLGVKYLIVADDADGVHPQYKRTKGDNGYSVLMNQNTLGPAFLVNETESGADNPFSFTSDLLASATGTDGKVFETVTVEERDYIDDSHSVRECVCTPESDGEVFFYLQGIADKVQNLMVYVDDEPYCSYGNYGNMKVLNLGYHKSGDTLKVRIDSDSETADFGRTLFYTENAHKLKEYCESRTGIEIERISSSEYKLVLPKERDAKGIMVTFPYEQGWIAKCKGVRIPVKMCYDTMLYIPLDGVSGDTIELDFVPEGFTVGLLFSIVSAVSIIIQFVLQAYHTRHYDLEK